MLSASMPESSFRSTKMNEIADELKQALRFLEIHHQAFYSIVEMARATDHPTPSDTRASSQILVSLLTDIKGLKRKKGPDLIDGSDVKGAITWEAIDTPRFNNVIKAGTKAETSGSIKYLDEVPYLFLVLWDHTPGDENPRCRIWCVRPQDDEVFRTMCDKWYAQRDRGEIRSDNFQLHPPRNLNSNVIRNTCGNLEYPLLFCAVRTEGEYRVIEYNPEVMERGECRVANDG